MTLIVPFISDDFVALASDRRITWLIGGAATDWEDTENKAIVLAGHFLMGYTGFARLDGVPTEQWVVDRLVGVEPVSTYFEVLARAAEPAVAAIRLPLEQSGHAFVAVGYGKTKSDPENLYACAINVSNALGGGYGSWSPRDDFAVERTTFIQAPDEFLASAFGMAPAREVMDETIDSIRRYRKENSGKALGVLELMVALIRQVAAVDEGVSASVSVSILPKRAVPAEGVTMPLHPLRDPIDELTCVFIPEDQDVEQALVYGPATVSPQAASFGFEAWTSKPPWWTD